ncbi:nucleotidyltransferase domain-containing protein [Variovorax sp. J22R133]|uniref:nucleotidyltransferase domain-containing protein n=1 Tax=Variovorax brevis TaxID=3053503 RepID=UPI002577144C|nr:nucleotidyltransferase domain-containing protein [Variovorax sp. J22R133]MDM0115553.1 nucleotidyltransferase domain-containing protein [Variovorax sp. J22R133]
MLNLGTTMPKMGTSAASRSAPPEGGGLGDALFTTTQQRVLGYLFGQPERSFFAKELINLTGSGSGAVQRELKHLADSGLLTITPVGNQKHYQANPTAPIYDELCGIVRKTFGLAGPLREALEPLREQIEAAFVFGSVAKKSDTAASDIDLMLISDDLSYGELFLALDEVSSRLGRTVNPTIMTGRELMQKHKNKESFVERVMAQPKLWVIGGADALPT